jgi:outer membrane protein OmpA-like peptidoglycan-associated protein
MVTGRQLLYALLRGIPVNPRTIPVLCLLTAAVAAAQMSDYQGYKDPALFTRMPHYFLSDQGSFVDTPFDAMEFQLKEGTQRVEGHHLVYNYYFDESAGANPGFLQIVRNYEAAAKRIGGQVLADDVRRATIRVAKNGQETWVAVEAFNEGREYKLDIIEKQAMQQDVAANAEALKSGLADTGHVEVPGIFFDFGKSVVKPESEAALKEVVKMLQASPAMKVWVVGHTDNVGTVESNMALSGARAAAVVKSLVQMGVGIGRLAPHGAGPYAPVAPNTTDEGRAHNRRVELVAQP